VVSTANNGNSGPGGTPRPPESSRQRALKRGAVVGVLASLAAATLALGAACLPSLSPIPDAPTPVEGSTPFVGCGDGLIATLDDGGDAGESCDPGKPNDPDAQAPGCSACRIVCEKDGVIDPRTGHCYFPVDPSDNYQAAITSCKARGAHVVTFASAAEVTLVQGVTGGAGASGFWVGLSRSSALGEAYGPDRPEEPASRSRRNRALPALPAARARAASASAPTRTRTAERSASTIPAALRRPAASRP